jgi:hypothetical protein
VHHHVWLPLACTSVHLRMHVHVCMCAGVRVRVSVGARVRIREVGRGEGERPPARCLRGPQKTPMVRRGLELLSCLTPRPAGRPARHASPRAITLSSCAVHRCAGQAQETPRSALVLLHMQRDFAAKANVAPPVAAVADLRARGAWDFVVHVLDEHPVNASYFSSCCPVRGRGRDGVWGRGAHARPAPAFPPLLATAFEVCVATANLHRCQAPAFLEVRCERCSGSLQSFICGKAWGALRRGGAVGCLVGPAHPV